jgi:lipid-A-disaccharide synthase
MTAAPLIYVVAVERSGDLLGAALMRSLQTKTGGEVRFAGIGGRAMAEEGVASAIDISDLAIFGWIDGLMAYKRVKAAVAASVEDILRVKPDAVVLIDSWGYTLRVAQGVRQADPSIRLIKYVGPQVFATRPGRAATLAATVDRLLTILDFDAPYYEAHGLPVTFVGNPTLERLEAGDGTAFRARHAIPAGAPVLTVLFGSRTSEIRRMFGPFARAVARLRQRYPGLSIVIPIADPVEADLRARLENERCFNGAVLVEETEKADAFAAADAALACSGTVVTELATAGVPTVTSYRLGWITWALARTFNLMKAKYISLVNISADAELVPELVQTRATGANLAEAVGALMDDAGRRETLSRKLIETTARMRGDGKASDRAADAVLETLDGSTGQ